MNTKVADVLGGVLRNIALLALFWGRAWSLELPAAPFSNLRAEEFRIRESAQAELLVWARGQRESAIDELFRQSKIADDPEVRERCLGILRELVIDEYLNEGPGFMGIQGQDEITNPGDPNPRTAIRVKHLVPDSPAQKAGLQVGDLIAGLGDEVWLAGGAWLPFCEKIRKTKPNTSVTLKVMRGGELVDIVVKLVRRPVGADIQFFDEGQLDPEAAEQSARDAYFRHWLDRRKSAK